MARVFLSHASADKVVVRRIESALRNAGHDPWFDEKEILVGESIPAAVERGLRSSDFVLVCLSEAAASHGWVEAERDATVIQQFRERTRRILPVRLQDVEPPHLLAQLAYADLFPDDQAFTSGLAKVVRSIDAHQACADETRIRSQVTGAKPVSTSRAHPQEEGAENRWPPNLPTTPLASDGNAVPSNQVAAEAKTTSIPAKGARFIGSAISHNRLLIVDDNVKNTMLLAYLLRTIGYDVETALDAESAVEAIHLRRPEVVLMDIQLPGISGLELTRQLKADPATRDIVVIAMTAYGLPNDRDKMLKAGCDDFTTKPIDARNLLEIVARHLTARTQPAV